MSTHRRAHSGRRRARSLISMIGVAIIVTGMLSLPAASPLSAHPARAHLPILRLRGGPGVILDNVGGSYSFHFPAVNASLVRLLPSGRVVGDLATPSISKNHLVYTFTIRPNARFSNGHFVTAYDAAFSLKRFLAPTNPGSTGLTYLGLIKGASDFHAGTTHQLSGVTVLSNRVLRITIIKPAAYFLATLAPYSAVFDRSVLAGKPLGKPPDFKTNYLTHTCTGNQGAGPFMFVCHDRSSTLHSFYSGHKLMITLVPNPYYYGHKPHLIIEGLATTNDYKLYRAGKVDESVLSLPLLNRWRGSRELHEYPESAVFYLRPNVHLAPFNNLHCRLAAAYALDRQTINDHVLNGTQRATYDLVPRGMLGYYAGNDNPHYNLHRARAEFAQCLSRTTAVEVTFPNDAVSRNQGIVAVRNLAAAGFNIKLKLLSQNDWFTSVSQPLDKTKTQIIFDGWNQDYPDPQDYCSLQLRSGSQFNTGGWSNTTYDRLVDRADVILNPKQRATLYIRAQHIAFSQGALISLSNGLGFVVLKPYVHGLVFTEAYVWQQPKDGNWANVWISPH